MWDYISRQEFIHSFSLSVNGVKVQTMLKMRYIFKRLYCDATRLWAGPQGGHRGSAPPLLRVALWTAVAPRYDTGARRLDAPQYKALFFLF